MQAHAIVKDKVTSTQPKNVEYRAEYDPDMARMVKALRALLDYNSAQARQTSEKSTKLAKRAFEVITISHRESPPF